MKTLNELLEGVRDCEEMAAEHSYIPAYKDESMFGEPSDAGGGSFDDDASESFKVGHAAACEVLVPALKEAMTCLEYYPTNLVKDCEERIASLLSGKKAGG